MNKIAVVYWSGTGNTETMANLIAAGARGAGATVDVFTPAEFAPAQVADYDVLALGCPAMGSEQLEESEFEPMYDTLRPVLNGKKVALFGSYSWAEGEWIAAWAEDCAGTGANMVAAPLKAYAAPEGDDADACTALGAALATV